MALNFDNTENAYSYLSDKELKKSHFIFRILNNNFISKIGKSVTMTAFNIGLPIKGIVKKTIFDTFVGGESIEESEPEIKLLDEHNIGVILDYGAEAKDKEHELDEVAATFLTVIDSVKANKRSNMEVCAKITALASNDLLEKISAKATLTAEETHLWKRVEERVDQVCKKAYDNNIQIYIDAEESWIQQAIDDLVNDMMVKYNQEQPIVFNTIQLYRHDRLEFLKQSYQHALDNNYKLAVKLVRGAYMEKERARAEEKGYPSPIQDTKENTDRDYNLAVEFCIEHIDKIAFCVATHNEDSNYFLDELLREKNISINHPHIITAQLFGMGDHITFNMAKEGYNATKYLPYGPVKELLPYLLRRANENSSVDGQASRELTLVQKELKRRKLNR